MADHKLLFLMVKFVTKQYIRHVTHVTCFESYQHCAWRKQAFNSMDTNLWCLLFEDSNWYFDYYCCCCWALVIKREADQKPLLHELLMTMPQNQRHGVHGPFIPFNLWPTSCQPLEVHGSEEDHGGPWKAYGRPWMAYGRPGKVCGRPRKVHTRSIGVRKQLQEATWGHVEATEVPIRS
jgi:hypothetical protein